MHTLKKLPQISPITKLKTAAKVQYSPHGANGFTGAYNQCKVGSGNDFQQISSIGTILPAGGWYTLAIDLPRPQFHNVFMWHIFIIGLVMGLTAAAVPGPINLEVV